MSASRYVRGSPRSLTTEVGIPGGATFRTVAPAEKVDLALAEIIADARRPLLDALQGVIDAVDLEDAWARAGRALDQ